MIVAKTIEEYKKIRKNLKGSVGFVPTMGYLHEGHLSLVRKSKEENDFTVTSIYVNPTQFGPHEDFNKYPRDLERDLKLLQNVNNDIVFLPDNKEMYPDNFSTWVNVENLTDVLEGKARPGHFKGVTTIVTKLFNIVEPHRAYFGQKDAQQALVIKKMVKDLNMNLEIVIMPTVREKDGLAMSSRNIYLNNEERKAAPVLYKALKLAKKLHSENINDAEFIKDKMEQLIKTEPLAKIDYISIADTESLQELSKIDNKALVSLAVKFGNTRLIDNIIID